MTWARPQSLKPDRGAGDKHHHHAATAAGHADLVVQADHRIRAQIAGALLDLVGRLHPGFFQRPLQGLGTPTEKSRIPAKTSRTTLIPCTDSALTISRYSAISRPAIAWVVVIITAFSFDRRDPALNPGGVAKKRDGSRPPRVAMESMSGAVAAAPCKAMPRASLSVIKSASG